MDLSISALLILPLVQNHLTHSIYVLDSLPLALTQTDIRYHLLPTCLLRQFLHILPEIFLFLDILSLSLSGLLLLFVPELLKLPPALFLTLFLLFPFLILHTSRHTFFYFNIF